jgi:hypothetical protein
MLATKRQCPRCKAPVVGYGLDSGRTKSRDTKAGPSESVKLEPCGCTAMHGDPDFQEFIENTRPA